VGLEAIAAATPILVSDKSGLGQLLREHLGDAAKLHVVEVHDDLKRDAEEWERRIEGVLLDREASFSRALKLRDELRPRLTWEAAVAALEAKMLTG
jgi:hypothetical protein